MIEGEDFSHAIDIRSADESLQMAENLFGPLADCIDQIFWLIEPYLKRVVYVSPAYERIRRQPRQQLYDNPAIFYDVVHPDDLDLVKHTIEQCSRGVRTDVEYRLVPRNEIRWVRVRAFPITNADGTVYRVAGITEDVTECKQLEKSVRGAQALLQNLLDNAPAPIYANTADSRYLMVNRAWEKVSLRTRDQVIGRCSRDVWPEHTLEQFQASDRQVFESGRPFVLEETVDTEYGRRHFHTVKFPVQDGEGRPNIICGMSIDITERKLAEQECLRYTAQLHKLADAMPKISANLSVEQVLQTLTDQAREIVGSHMASIIQVMGDGRRPQTFRYSSLSPECEACKGFEKEQEYVRLCALVWQRNRPVRLTRAELEAERQSGGGNSGNSPLQGWLAVPFSTRDGRNMGLIQLSNKYSGEFSPSDESILVQLAHMGSVALENARLYQQVEDGRKRMLRLSQQVVSAQENERRLLAHELHDETGQALTALKINLEVTQAHLIRQLPEEALELNEAVSAIESIMEQVRAMAHSLRPPLLDAVGLNDTLEGLCRNFSRMTHLSIEYSGCPLPALPDPLNITLYRILQEALTNVAKHARAEQVRVCLNRGDDFIRLSVIDDGIGFDSLVERPRNNYIENMGLIGMRERLELLGGSFEIQSQPGRGTVLLATVPHVDEPKPAPWTGQ